MSIYTLAPSPWLVFLDDHGVYVPNGQLAVYQAGTTTPALTYMTADGPAHPFPITLDGAGRVPSGLYLQPSLSYKFVLHAPKIEEPLDGAIIKTQDNVGAVPLSGGAILSINTPGDYSGLNVSGVDIIDYAGGGDVNIRGLLGGINGQQILIRNRSNFTVWLYSADTAAAGPDRLYNFFIYGPTPLNGPPGMARYSYTTVGGIGWVMDGHEQGRPITPPYNAADFTTVPAGAWTVEPGDVTTDRFYLQGRNVQYAFRFDNTSVAGAGITTLSRLLPFGWRAFQVSNMSSILTSVDSNVNSQLGLAVMTDPTHVLFQQMPQPSTWPVTTNSVIVYGQLTIPLF